MTDRGRTLPVAAIAGALFCVVLTYLALQIRAGRDPAIGAAKPRAAEVGRQVIVRRVIVRRIVEEPAAGSAPAAASGGQVAFAPSPATASAPAAPAAPAPAPAPAPVVSGGS